MTELERIDKVINDLYSIRDVALSVFGDEGYFALDDSIRSLTKTWTICKRGQEEKLKNAYHTPINNSRKPIKSHRVSKFTSKTGYEDEDIKKAIEDMGLEWEDDEVGNTWNNTYLMFNGDKIAYIDWHTWPLIRISRWSEVLPSQYESSSIEEFKEDLYDIKMILRKSREPIKSSLEDRLVPYLEEFEEGYANALSSTDEMGHNARLETFYEIFKNDYNLSDNDISKLEGAVQDIWHETEEDTEHDMGEMYGAPHGATPEEALKHFE